MKYAKKKVRLGFTLVEVILAAAIGVIISIIVGMLLYAGQSNWKSTFNQSNKGIEIDALNTMLTFGSFGRQSNKEDYAVYTGGNGFFSRAKPSPLTPVQVVTGQAVEFRYWNTPLNAALMTTATTATAYMLFYLNGTNLMVDQGLYPPGGVPNFGNTRQSGAGVTTRVLAQNVTYLQFSHTTRNAQGDGDGCVRIDMTLTDPNSGRTITVETATLMRNDWGATPAHN